MWKFFLALWRHLTGPKIPGGIKRKSMPLPPETEEGAPPPFKFRGTGT